MYNVALSKCFIHYLKVIYSLWMLDRVQNVSNSNGDIAISLRPNLLLHNVVWLVRVLTHSIYEWEKKYMYCCKLRAIPFSWYTIWLSNSESQWSNYIDIRAHACIRIYKSVYIIRLLTIFTFLMIH